MVGEGGLSGSPSFFYAPPHASCTKPRTAGLLCPPAGLVHLGTHGRCAAASPLRGLGGLVSGSQGSVWPPVGGLSFGESGIW